MASQQHQQHADPQEQPYPQPSQPSAAEAEPIPGAVVPPEVPAPGDPQTAADTESAGGETEARAAERSAERAAALAATEGFHPLRMRPYVGEPEGGPGESTVRPLIVDDENGPATTDLGMFPSMFSALEYAPQETPPLDSAAVHGRHRRRRRGVVVAAVSVAASALAAGAVAVTGQVMGDEAGTAERALPDASASAPDVQLPQDASKATATGAPPVLREAPGNSNAPGTPTAPASTAPSTPATATTTATIPTVTPTSTATLPTSPPSTDSTPPPTTPSEPPVQSGDADTSVLRMGDSGPAVADLQRALSAAHVYRGPADGVFDHDVQLAVTAYQLWHHIPETPLGTYGPLTRAALTHSDHHH